MKTGYSHRLFMLFFGFFLSFMLFFSTDMYSICIYPDLKELFLKVEKRSEEDVLYFNDNDSYSRSYYHYTVSAKRSFDSGGWENCGKISFQNGNPIISKSNIIFENNMFSVRDNDSIPMPFVKIIKHFNDYNCDGVPDIWEGDSDNDNIPDVWCIDKNNDNIPDVWCIDKNNDGVPDIWHLDADKDQIPDVWNIYIDGDQIPDVLKIDTDNNGCSDLIKLDMDNDGVNDIEELIYASAPFELATLDNDTQIFYSLASNGENYLVVWCTTSGLEWIYVKNDIISELFTLRVDNDNHYSLLASSAYDKEYLILYNNKFSDIGSSYRMRLPSKPQETSPTLISIQHQLAHFGDLYKTYIVSNNDSHLFAYTSTLLGVPSIFLERNNDLQERSCDFFQPTLTSPYIGLCSNNNEYGFLSYKSEKNQYSLNLDYIDSNGYHIDSQVFRNVLNNDTNNSILTCTNGVYNLFLSYQNLRPVADFVDFKLVYEPYSSPWGSSEPNFNRSNFEGHPVCIASNGMHYLYVYNDNDVIYAQIYNSNGNTISRKFTIMAGTPQVETPCIATSSRTGEFFIVWPKNNKLYGRFITGYGTSPFSPDSDSDGLTDWVEINEYNTDPTAWDTDSDGFSDYYEVNNDSLDPLNPDDDNDGLSTKTEIEIHSLHLVWDSSNDGYSDGLAYLKNCHPNAECDFDKDYVSNRVENIIGVYFASESKWIFTDGLNPDTDGDGIMDGAELAADYIPEFSISGLLQSNITVAYYDPYVNIGSNGNTYIVVWSQQHDQAETSVIKRWDIYAQILNIDGSFTTAPFFLQTYYYSEPRDVVIGSNGDSYILVWPDYDGDNDGAVFQDIDNNTWYSQLTQCNLGIYAQIVKSNGALVGSRLRVNTYTPNNQQQPAVAAMGKNYLVTWQSHISSALHEDIRGQFLSADCTKIGDEFTINTNTAGQQSNPAVESGGNHYLVVWEDRSSGYQIKGQFLDNEGALLGAEFQINDTAYNDNLLPSVASVTTSTGTTFLVTWHSRSSGSYDVVARLITFTGTGHSFLSDQFQINQYTASDQNVADVASDGERFLVCWASVGQGGTNEDIFARFVDQSGEMDNDEFQVNIYTEGKEYRSQVASNGFNFCVTWTSMNTVQKTATVYGSIYRLRSGINPTSPDSDNDGLPDPWEISNFTNPLSNLDAGYDMDCDGLTNAQEFYYSTDPWSSDTDRDGLSDYDEIFNYFTSPINIDSDNDSISDYDELFVYYTDPLNPDSDNDGLSDGDEIKGIYVPEFLVAQIGTTTLKNQPRISSNGSNYCVIWQKNPQTIIYKLYDNSGIPLSSDLEINTHASSKPLYADIASDGFNYLIVYGGFDDGQQKIMGQLIDNEGQKDGSSFIISSSNAIQPESPSTAYGDGVYLVCWQSEYADNESNLEIFGQILNTTGQILTPELHINTTTLKDQFKVHAVWNGSYFFVTWFDQSSAWDVKGQLVGSDGSMVASEFLVNSYFIDEQFDAVSAFNGSNILSIWCSRTQDGDNEGIFAQLSDTDANIIGNEFRINTQSSGNQRTPCGISNGTDYFVVWASEQNGGDGYDIIARYLTADGVTKGSEFFVNHKTTGNQHNPRVSSNGTNYFVVWEDNDGDSYAIRAALFDPDMTTDPNNPDTDNDGIPDGWERDHGTNPLVPDPQEHDSDNDGLNNLEENNYGTNPLNPDTDNDGLTDGKEVLIYSTNPLNPDTDNDGLTDGEEVLIYTTDPLNPDTDNDGLTDGEEVLAKIVHEILLSDQNSSRFPFVASDGSGYLVVWSEQIASGQYGVNGQHLARDGEKIGEKFLIGTYQFSEHLMIAVESNGSNYLVVWPAEDGNNLGVYGSIINNAGSVLVPAFLINTYTDNYQFMPSIATDGEKYLVTWQSGYGQDGDKYGIYGQFVSSQGSKINNEFIINEYTSQDQIYPDTAFNGKYFYVGWENRSGSWELGGKTFDRFGYAQSSEFQINTTTTGWQLLPSIASNGHSFVATWHSNGHGNGYEIIAQLFDNEGTKIGGEIIVNTLHDDDQYAAAVASNRLDYFISWNSNTHDGDGYGIFGQRMKADGSKIGTEFQINIQTINNQMYPQLASNGKGYVVVWESRHPDNSGFSIYASVYDWGYGTDPRDNDSDNDGLSDGDEINLYGTNPMLRDSDFDGIDDFTEILGATDPIDPDTDNDGLLDGEESLYGTSPINGDSDGDSLLDGEEIAIGTNPLDSDTDGDLVFDNEELYAGTDPLSDQSTPEYIVLILDNDACGQDTFVDTNYPVNTYGNDNEITVASCNHEGAQQLLFIQFEIPDNPTGKEIAYAELQLYMNENKTPANEQAVYLHRILEPWDEMTASFNTRPSVSGEPISCVLINGNAKWVKIDTTDFVREWKDQAVENYGVHLNMTVPSLVDNRKRFYSSEHGSSRPRLRIIYR